MEWIQRRNSLKALVFLVQSFLATSSLFAVVGPVNPRPCRTYCRSNEPRFTTTDPSVAEGKSSSHLHIGSSQ